MRNAAIFVFAAFLAAVPARAQDFDAAYDAFEAQDWTAAFQQFLPLAEGGHPRAQLHLGYLYSEGLGVEQDFAQAAGWFHEAAVQGDMDAQFFLGDLYYDGLGVPLDRSEAATWYRAAADQGDVDAQYYLGLMYEIGDGVPEDDVTAAKWMRSAAEQGDADAQFRMGLNYDGGLGVPQDYARAATWYRRSAEQGHPVAQFFLGYSYQVGEGVEEDVEQAAIWFQRSADQGDPNAQLAFAKLLDAGRGVGQDYALAVEYYRLAADQGAAEAQYELGRSYRGGYGVAEDKLAAMEWFRMAAGQDHGAAQYELARMYDEGEGVALDDLQAAYWYQESALNGIPESANNLGVMYHYGEGVRADNVLAWLWYSIASDFGNYELALNNLIELSAGMTATEIEQGRALLAAYASGDYSYLLPPPGGGQPGAAQPGAGDEDVARVQSALAALGYDTGPADGIMRARTRAAIRAFQQDYGLAANGEIDAQLTVALQVARVAEARRPRSADALGAFADDDLELVATGTGFVVSAQGDVLTNNHVIDGCRAVRVRSSDQQSVAARVIAAEADSNLALLRAADLQVGAVAAFRAGRGIRPGDDVVVLGYPLYGSRMVTAAEAIVTTGTVSALAGPGEDRRILQLTAPVQPGNSGGPVLDSAGNLVGVVVAKLDALVVADAIGDIPQNINFAIQAWMAQTFLDSHAIEYRTEPSGAALGLADVASAARAFTVLVECMA